MNNKLYSSKESNKDIDTNKLNSILKTYNSFSGTDMVATMYLSGLTDVQDGAVVLGSLQTISYSIHMDRKPVRSISNINAKSYVMGPRTIAGSLVFAVFDKHFTYEAVKKLNSSNQNVRYILADEMPPFDITITFANEYHQKAKLAIYGVRLVNEGQIMSINDILTENTYQFVATDIQLLTDDDRVSGGNYFTPSGPTLETTDPENIEWIKPSEIEEVESESYGVYFLDVSTQAIKSGDTTAAYSISFKEGTPTDGKIVIHKYAENSGGGYWTQYDSVKIGSTTPYPIIKQGAAGKYKAVYFNIDEVMMSPEEEFVIAYVKDSNYLPAPIVLERNSRSVIVSVSSVAEFLSYRVNNSIEKYTKIPLSTGTSQVIVKDLLPDTTYTIMAETKDSKSAETVFTTTEENMLQLLNDFNTYVALNSYVISNKGLSPTTVSEIIERARKLYMESFEKGTPLTPAQSLFKVKLELEAQKKLMGKTREIDIDALIYAAEVLCYEATLYFNRYGKYEDTFDIAPEIESHRKNEFQVKDSTDMLTIEPLDKPKIKVRKQESKLINNKEIIAKELIHNIYKIYGIEESGRYTGYKEHLSVTEILKRRLKELEDSAYANKNLMLALAKEKSANYSSIYKYDDLLMACANDLNEYFNDAVDPIISDINDSKMMVEVLNPQNVIYNSMLLCIEESDKVMNDEAIRKVRCDKSNGFSAVLDFKRHALIKGLRYTIWYETEDNVAFKKISFVLDEDFEEDEVYITKSKIERDNLLKRLRLLCDRYQSGLLKDIIVSEVESSFENGYFTTEKAINNTLKALYNGNRMNRQLLCNAINICYKARNGLMSQNNSDDLSSIYYNTKEETIALVEPSQPVYVKMFKFTSDGIVFFEPKIISPGKHLSLHDELNSSDIVVLYIVDKTKSKIGAPFVFDSINKNFYGGRVIYDN